MSPSTKSLRVVCVAIPYNPETDEILMVSSRKHPLLWIRASSLNPTKEEEGRKKMLSSRLTFLRSRLFPCSSHAPSSSFPSSDGNTVPKGGWEKKLGESLAEAARREAGEEGTSASSPTLQSVQKYPPFSIPTYNTTVRDVFSAPCSTARTLRALQIE